MIKQFITTIVPQAECLILTFTHSWFQEDIETLMKLVFTPLNSVIVQERIMGADRENIRFSWQEHYFILNFDCCSQSCWLEGQDNASTDYLEQLYSDLSKV
jgi:hypothetical protein